MLHFNLLLRSEVGLIPSLSLAYTSSKWFWIFLKTLKLFTFSLNSFSRWFVVKRFCGLLLLLVVSCIGLMGLCNKVSGN